MKDPFKKDPHYVVDVISPRSKQINSVPIGGEVNGVNLFLDRAYTKVRSKTWRNSSRSIRNLLGHWLLVNLGLVIAGLLSGARLSGGVLCFYQVGHFSSRGT